MNALKHTIGAIRLGRGLLSRNQENFHDNLKNEPSNSHALLHTQNMDYKDFYT